MRIGLEGGAGVEPAPAGRGDEGSASHLVAESARLLGIARRAALDVGGPLRAAFRSAMDLAYKRDFRDVVTIHDKRSEERIAAILRAEAPDSVIVGEEGGETGSGRLRWYVDPIDGTANFARGIAQWCVSIAAAAEDRLLAGVVYDPVADNLFAADLSGASLNGARLTARAFAEESRATLLSSFPKHRDIEALGGRAFDAQAELLGAFMTIRNLGSAALNLAHVAAGWSDATIGFDASPWDVAAGALILEQAGGRFAGYRRGGEFTPSFLAPDYLAIGYGGSYPTLERVMQGLSRALADGAIGDGAAGA
jgi:myo-inositol-1(or 4)-monophosphatase